MDDQGNIAEDLRTQILGQLAEKLNYERLYQQALADPELRRTKVELEAALNNADMMGAGFGDPKFFTTDSSHYAKNTPFYSTAGTENYGKGDAKKAMIGTISSPHAVTRTSRAPRRPARSCRGAIRLRE